MGGRATRMIVAAVVAGLLATPLLALVVVSVLEVGDARRDIDETRADHGEAALERADTLVDRLQDERDWWVFELLGISDIFDLGPSFDADSPQRTDQAIADLRTEIADRTGDEGGVDPAPLAAALEGLTELQEVRSGAEDAIAGPDGGTLASTTAAQGVFDTYAAHIAAIRSAADIAIVAGIDDPDLRHGAELELRASGQLSLTHELGRRLMLAAVGDGATTPEEIAALSMADGQWRSGLAEIEAAPAPYRALVAEHLPDGLTAAVQSHAEQVISSGTADLSVLLADFEAAATGFVDLENAIAQRRADEVEEAIDAARDRERRSLMVAGGALAGLVLLAGVVIALVVSTRSRPPSGPPSDRASEMQPPIPPPLMPDRV